MYIFLLHKLPVYGMTWLGCLDDQSALSPSSATSSPELFHQMKSFFVCPEILDAEKGVCGDDGHQTYIAEIKAFSYDLRAYKYVDVSFCKVLDCLCFVCFVL